MNCGVAFRFLLSDSSSTIFPMANHRAAFSRLGVVSKNLHNRSELTTISYFSFIFFIRRICHFAPDIKQHWVCLKIVPQ